MITDASAEIRTQYLLSNMNLKGYHYVNLLSSVTFLRNDGNEVPDDKEPLFRKL
jgi:hypothetical protein